MKKNISFIVSLVAGLLMSSCSEWNDHFDDNGVTGSNTTLWEEIQSRPELSDFAKVLEHTKVFRQHKKTATSYAQLLEGGQSFTVFAPVNGTFNCDSIIRLTETNSGDSAVECFFIKNHIARTPHSAIESSFRMLNNKRVTMTPTDVWGSPLAEKNVRSKNGILHTVSVDLPYNNTIYEALTRFPEYSEVGEALTKYNEDQFDENSSVQIGLVEGVPVYADSVIYEYNKMLSYIGPITEEDSTYYVSVPTNDGWKRAWDKVSPYFRFSPKLEKADSLQNFFTIHSLLGDGIFSKTVQSSMTDSVKSGQYNRSTPEYHVFYKPFEADGLFGKAKQTYNCSNGTLYAYDEWPFDPQKTFFRKIELEGEYSWYITEQKNVTTMNSVSLSADSISRGAFLDVNSSGSNNWKLTFKLDNTLSGKYDVCIVILPKTVTDPTNTKTKPCQFKAYMNYLDENGDPVTKDFGTFKTSKNMIDTMVVATDFVFPVCNFNQNNDKITITLESSVTQKQIATLDRRMYLDCIYLKPKE